MKQKLVSESHNRKGMNDDDEKKGAKYEMT